MPRGSGKYILVWIDFDLEKKKKIITLSNPIDFLEIEIKIWFHSVSIILIFNFFLLFVSVFNRFWIRSALGFGPLLVSIN